MDPFTALAVLGPLAVEAGKAAIARFIAPDTFKPTTVADWLAMKNADTALFEAMQDKGGPFAWPWVEAVIRLQRPAVVGCAFLVWAWQEMTIPTGATDTVANFTGAVGFYLFGDRTLTHMRSAINSASKTAP